MLTHRCCVPVQVWRDQGGVACWAELVDSPAAGRLVRRKRGDGLHFVVNDVMQHAERFLSLCLFIVCLCCCRGKHGCWGNSNRAVMKQRLTSCQRCMQTDTDRSTAAEIMLWGSVTPAVRTVKRFTLVQFDSTCQPQIHKKHQNQQRPNGTNKTSWNYLSNNQSLNGQKHSSAMNHFNYCSYFHSGLGNKIILNWNSN